MWMWAGYPQRLALLAHEDEHVAKRACDEFKRLYFAFEEAQKLRTRAWEQISARSVMHLVSCQQLAIALRKADWAITEGIRDHCLNRSRSLFQSRLVEDGLKRKL